MKYYCESGKHLLFDSEMFSPCGACACRQCLIDSQKVMPIATETSTQAAGQGPVAANAKATES